MVSRGYGSRDMKLISETVHTSILLSLTAGAFIAVAGFLLTRQALSAMGSPENIIDKSTLYMHIFFLGTPANITYNFGSAVLRSVGDTKRPLYIGAFSGIINVLLNLIFVITFHMDVAGVAIATIISQIISAFLVLRCLIRADGAYKLNIRKLKFHPAILKKIVYIGLPAGIQGVLFSVSNVLIQSSVNFFGSTFMAGNAAAAGAENFIYVAQNAFLHTALTGVAQNFGAKNKTRIKKTIAVSCVSVTAVGFTIGILMFLFAQPILGIYSHDTEVVKMGLLRASLLFPTFFLCGIMEVLVGSLRGLGSSLVPMITSLIGACVFRIIWIYTVFAQHTTPEVLYWSYPVSWILTSAVHLVCLIIIFRRKTKTFSL